MNWHKLLNSGRLKETSRTQSVQKQFNDKRNEFESDFGRIIFSPAMRRMHDKTQVFPLSIDDNIHTRLSHSMEVMSIGYSLGINLCNDERFIEHTGIAKAQLLSTVPIILKNSCLIHDIGNPPFGHFGESIIQNYFKKYFKNKESKLNNIEKKDFECFDGNAQGLRIVTKLQYLNDLYGLNLSYATLATFIKYPNYSNVNDKRIHTKKKGIFTTEKEYFQKIAKECGLKKGKGFIRHPLCYLMEAADSICYFVMDVEDGFYKGLIPISKLFKELLKININQEWKREISEIKQSNEKDRVKINKLRITLFKWLVNLVHNTFIEHLEEIEKGKFHKELLDVGESKKIKNVLKKFCQEYLFCNRNICSLELTGDSVISGLLDYYIRFILDEPSVYLNRAKNLISLSLIELSLKENNKKDISELSEYAKLRLIIDYISGMTDKFALLQYQQLYGQKIN